MRQAGHQAGAVVVRNSADHNTLTFMQAELPYDASTALMTRFL
jgi:hypothetical protein